MDPQLLQLLPRVGTEPVHAIGYEDRLGVRVCDLPGWDSLGSCPDWGAQHLDLELTSRVSGDAKATLKRANGPTQARHVTRGLAWRIPERFDALPSLRDRGYTEAEKVTLREHARGLWLAAIANEEMEKFTEANGMFTAAGLCFQLCEAELPNPQNEPGKEGVRLAREFKANLPELVAEWYGDRRSANWDLGHILKDKWMNVIPERYVPTDLIMAMVRREAVHQLCEDAVVLGRDRVVAYVRVSVKSPVPTPLRLTSCCMGMQQVAVERLEGRIQRHAAFGQRGVKIIHSICQRALSQQAGGGAKTRLAAQQHALRVAHPLFHPSLQALVSGLVREFFSLAEPVGEDF